MSDSARHDGIAAASRRRFLAAAGSVGVASLAATAAAAQETETDSEVGAEAEDAEEEEEADDEEATPFASIEFSNQYSEGTEIVVDATVLSDGGYVAIHDQTLFEGAVAPSVIGVSEYLEPGAHYRVPVELFDVPGSSFDRDSLDGTTPLVPMPHQETDGDETYDFVTSEGEEDGPYATAGLPVVDGGFVTVDSDPPEPTDDPFATVDFRNQAVDDAVTVRDVTVSHGGFVAVHDARLLAGAALESVVGVSDYLEAGQHQAVEVEIEDPEEITEVELPARPLLPMPHLDTNDTEEYDFVTSEGAEDGPYTKAGQAVIDAGLVTVDD